MNLLANYHCHTTYCDGKNTPEEMVLKALSLGFKHLGFSGHMDNGIMMDLNAYKNELNILKEKYKDKIEILIGIEQDNLFSIDNKDGLDYVIGSTHYLEVGTIDKEYPSVDTSIQELKKICEKYYDNDYYKLAFDYYKTEVKVIKNTKPSFIGHFDLITRFNDLPTNEGGHYLDENDDRYLDSALSCMKELLKAQIPFELNCGAFNRNRKVDFYPNTRLLKELNNLGGEILINSDAHDIEHLNSGFDKAILKAKECGFKYINILTRESNNNKVAKNTNGLYWKKIKLC